MPWLRQVYHQLLTAEPRIQSHVDFVVNEVAIRQVFHCHLSFHQTSNLRHYPYHPYPVQQTTVPRDPVSLHPKALLGFVMEEMTDDIEISSWYRNQQHHNRSPFLPVLKQFNTIHMFMTCFSDMDFNIIFPFSDGFFP
jgi:hypothetical protein